MAARPKSKLTHALTEQQIKDRVSDLIAENKAAADALQQHFGAERWQRIQAMAWAAGVDDAQLRSLCGKMSRTRKEWHPQNAQAALHAAAIGLLITLGGHPSPQDVEAFEKVKDQPAN